MQNQYFDKNDTDFKLDLELFEDDKEVTFTILKRINETKDERIEEVHLQREDLLTLTFSLMALLNIESKQ